MIHAIANIVAIVVLTFVVAGVGYEVGVNFDRVLAALLGRPMR